jgi:large subunit ribosomal protein L19
MDKIKAIENEQIRDNALTLNIGDTVKVHVKIKEGNKERVQVFEGTIIKRQRGGSNETFTVRKIAYGVGVERTFLVNSPKVEKVEVVRPGKIRRAKLYYLRDRVGKATRVKAKITSKEDATTESAE